MRCRARLLTLVLLTLLLVQGCGVLPKDVASPVCHLLVRLYAPRPSSKEFKACVKAASASAPAVLGEWAGPELEPLDGFEALTPEKAGATRTSNATIVFHTVEGSAKADAFPVSTLDVPLARLGGGPFDVQAGMLFFNDDFGAPKKLFGSVEATLVSVDGEGGRTALGMTTVKLTKKNPGAAILFEGVEDAESGARLEAEIRALGGSVKNATVVAVASASPAGGQSAARAETEDVVTRGEVGAPRPWTAPAAVEIARGVRSTPPSTLASYSSSGTLKAKKFPKILIDLPPLGEGAAVVSGGLTVLTKSYGTPKKKLRPKTVSVTLFAIDADGVATKVKSKDRKVDGSGSADFEFKVGGGEPPGGHFRVSVKLKGRKVKNAYLTAFAAGAVR